MASPWLEVAGLLGAPMVTVGEVLVGVALHSTCNKGAALPTGVASYDFATRWPLPVIMRTRELPPAQPGRFTSS